MTLIAEGLALAGRLEPLTLTLKPGQVIAICGPNGAGKSTLLEALAGLLPGHDGAVRLDQSDLAALPARERARAIGYLPQSREIAWDVPVRQLVALGRLPHGDSADQPIDAALAALDIAHLATRRVQRLSGGEQARALLARVLAGTPRWILADEPLAALDLSHQLALLRHFRLLAQGGTGVVLVLHDLAQAMNHADRVIVLRGGKLLADGPPVEALAESVIARGWDITARWLGEDGARALVAVPSVAASWPAKT